MRRQLERSHAWLREELRRRDALPAKSEPHCGMVRYGSSDTGYDDDWTATSMALLPDDPDSLVGAAAKEIEKEVVGD